MKGMLEACITGGAEKEWVEYELVDTTTVKQLKGGSMGAEICVWPSLGKPHLPQALVGTSPDLPPHRFRDWTHTPPTTLHPSEYLFPLSRHK